MVVTTADLEVPVVFPVLKAAFPVGEARRPPADSLFLFQVVRDRVCELPNTIIGWGDCGIGGANYIPSHVKPTVLSQTIQSASGLLATEKNKNNKINKMYRPMGSDTCSAVFLVPRV